MATIELLDPGNEGVWIGRDDFKLRISGHLVDLAGLDIVAHHAQINRNRPLSLGVDHMKNYRAVAPTGDYVQAIRHVPNLEEVAAHVLAVELHDLRNGHQECLAARDRDHHGVYLPSCATEICEGTDLEQFTVTKVYIHEPGIGHTGRPR